MLILMYLGFALWAAALLVFAARTRPALAGGFERHESAWMSSLEGDDESRPQASGGAALSPEALAVRSFAARPRTREIVRGWLLRLSIPRQHVDDLAADVIAGAIESAHRYDPAFAPIDRWLNAITFHLAAHWHEKAQRREVLAARVVPPGAEEAADVALEREEARAAVRAFLLQMPIELAAMVQGHDLEERPVAELAEEQGIPLSTAYKRRARGLAVLGDLLREWAKAW